MVDVCKFSLSSLDDLQGDIIAGVTVGLTLIPQSIAYAGIAQLAPQVRYDCLVTFSTAWRLLLWFALV